MPGLCVVFSLCVYDGVLGVLRVFGLRLCVFVCVLLKHANVICL